jgi:protein TonB
MLGSIVLAILVAQAAPGLPGQVTPKQMWPPADVVKVDGDVTAPRLIKEVKPRYPAGAKSARIAGSVMLEAVVNRDGTVGEVRVARSLDTEYGLDDEAVKALKKWKFSPGKKDGIAVPVLVEVEMTFSVQ